MRYSKVRPKYTPPKVCKKSATVLLPTWNFIQCPKVQTLTIKIQWPEEELLPLPSVQTTINKANQDPTDPCTWIFSGNFLDQSYVGRINFNPIGPELTIEFERFFTGTPTLYYLYGSAFGDYDSRKPKLLLPSNIEPDTTSFARQWALAQVTI